MVVLGTGTQAVDFQAQRTPGLLATRAGARAVDTCPALAAQDDQRVARLLGFQDQLHHRDSSVHGPEKQKARVLVQPGPGGGRGVVYRRLPFTASGGIAVNRTPIPVPDGPAAAAWRTPDRTHGNRAGSMAVR